MQWVTALAVPVVFAFCWSLTLTVQASFPRLRNKRICLLIAHPDDEAMFFAPTVLALSDESLGNHVKILCLSSGDADGLGEVRKKELVKSAMKLGLRKEDDVFVVEDPDLPDSMTTTWSATHISKLLAAAFAPNMNKTSSKEPPKAAIDVLITFDRHGISSHPNHISLYHGSIAFIKALMHGHTGWECPVALYTLRSTNIVRKYMSLLDAPATLLQTVLGGVKKVSGYPTPLLIVSSPVGYRTAQQAMTTAHQSQMRWFRWGWIAVSRYMVMNDLSMEIVK